jgi:3-hydroxyisobutyrate dehydrogenase-like beta-hydroxyacid dehydrogenase
MKIAFAGLGVMGAPMARHLLAAGHDVTGYNRSPAKALAWAEPTAARTFGRDRRRGREGRRAVRPVRRQ